MVAEGFDDRQVFVEYGFVAADPDGELAALGAFGSAAHGRVEEVDVLLLEVGVDAADHGWGVGARVEPGGDAFDLLGYRLYFRWLRQKSDHQKATAIYRESPYGLREVAVAMGAVAFGLRETVS